MIAEMEMLQVEVERKEEGDRDDVVLGGGRSESGDQEIRRTEQNRTEVTVLGTKGGRTGRTLYRFALHSGGVGLKI